MRKASIPGQGRAGKCTDGQVPDYPVWRPTELAASLRYLTQRYTMPTGQAKAILTDIGTEELAHLEIIATLVYKLMDRRR